MTIGRQRLGGHVILLDLLYAGSGMIILPRREVCQVIFETNVFKVSDQVRHKPGCAATEDDQRLEMWI